MLVLPVCHAQHPMLQLSLERDEHKLVIDQLSTLEGDRKAFRLIGGVLVERTVGEVLPQVKQNHQGVSGVNVTLNNQQPRLMLK